MKDIDTVIECLTKDADCSKSMLDWIVNRIEDLNEPYTILKYNNGYALTVGKVTSVYLYTSF